MPSPMVHPNPIQSHLYLITPTKFLFLNKVTFTSTWGYGLNTSFLEDSVQLSAGRLPIQNQILGPQLRSNELGLQGWGFNLQASGQSQKQAGSISKASEPSWAVAPLSWPGHSPERVLLSLATVGGSAEPLDHPALARLNFQFQSPGNPCHLSKF